MDMTSLIDAGIGGSVVALINYVLTYQKQAKLEDKINNNLEQRVTNLEQNSMPKDQVMSQLSKLFEKVDAVALTTAKIEGKLEAQEKGTKHNG